MKKMPFIKFSLCLLIACSGFAQTTKTFKESFNVNKDAEIILSADHAEIIIETWNKNQVEVEATVTVESEDKKLAEKILADFQFEALGNSSKVEIRAKSKNASFPSLGKIIDMDEIEIFTNDIKGIKFPNMPDISQMKLDFDFDMEKFNEEGKAYIIKFQDKIKEMVNDTTFKKEIKEWKLMIENELKDINFSTDSLRVFTYGLRNQPQVDVKTITIPNAQVIGKTNLPMKKKIIIRMPKEANLKLDVKQSQLKVASLHQIDANLNYSGLHIDELFSKHSKIEANYSDVNIKKANGLNLNLKYAKKIQIGEVNELISNSKTSNLDIDKINEKAIIEGSFGKLNIKNINPNFKLIDIYLTNSTAKLNLPEVDYSFYINSKSSEINVGDVLDYKVNTAFDSKIYQNKKEMNTPRSLNIRADYSTFELF